MVFENNDNGDFSKPASVVKDKIPLLAMVPPDDAPNSASEAFLEARNENDFEVLVSSPQQRLLQADDNCAAFRVADTPYNADQSIRPRAGIMFDIVSSGERTLTLETLELDVNWQGLEDFSVQVFASIDEDSDGEQASMIFNQPSAWRKVADTLLVPNPERTSALIPAHDFEDIILRPWKRRALYVRLGAGAFLESTFNPQIPLGQSAGQVGVDQDFTVYAGIPIESSSPRYPTEFDRAVAPIFAGKLLYGAENDPFCISRTSVVMTVVDYRFYVDRALSEALMASVASAIRGALQIPMQDDGALREYSGSFSLRLPQAGVVTDPLVSSPGKCAPQWNACWLMQVRANFGHKPGLTSRSVRARLYKPANLSPVLDAVNKALTPQGVLTQYVGLSRTQASFQMVLTGVDRGRKMDDVMLFAFREALLNALNRGLPGDWSEVHEMKGIKQVPLQRRHRHLLRGIDVDDEEDDQLSEQRPQRELFEWGSLRLEGVMFGAFQRGISDDPDEEFSERVFDALLSTKEEMTNQFKYDILLPGPISDGNGHIFFQEMQINDALFEPRSSGTTLDSPTDKKDDDDFFDGVKEKSKENRDLLLIFGIVGGVLLLCIVFCTCLLCCGSCDGAPRRQTRRPRGQTRRPVRRRPRPTGGSDDSSDDASTGGPPLQRSRLKGPADQSPSSTRRSSRRTMPLSDEFDTPLDSLSTASSSSARQGPTTPAPIMSPPSHSYSGLIHGDDSHPSDRRPHRSRAQSERLPRSGFEGRPQKSRSSSAKAFDPPTGEDRRNRPIRKSGNRPPPERKLDRPEHYTESEHGSRRSKRMDGEMRSSSGHQREQDRRRGRDGRRHAGDPLRNSSHEMEKRRGGGGKDRLTRSEHLPGVRRSGQDPPAGSGKPRKLSSVGSGDETSFSGEETFHEDEFDDIKIKNNSPNRSKERRSAPAKSLLDSGEQERPRPRRTASDMKRSNHSNSSSAAVRGSGRRKRSEARLSP